MSEWKTSTLGDVCHTFRSGGTPTSGWSEYYGGSIPFVTIEDMTACNKHLSSTRKTITDAGLSASAAWLVPSQHLLYSMYATLGKTRINTLPVATNQAVAAILPDPLRLDLSYLYYALSNLEQQVHRFTSQTTQANLNAGIVKSFDIGHPSSIPEQRKIARILTTVDNLIEQTEALIEKYKSIKQGMMHDLFTRGVDQSGQLRPSYEEAPELYKESELGWIPKEWEEKLLIEIASYQTGSAFPSADYGKEGIRLLRPGNLQVDEYVQWDDGHTTFLPLKWRTQASEYLLSGGEIVMNLTAQSLEDQFLGRVCLTPLGAESLLNQRIAKIRPRSCDHGFLFWAFKGPRFRFQVDRLTQGTKVQHIYNSNLNAIGIAIPAKQHEQKEIAQRLFTITNQIRSEVESRNKLQLIKTGLMQDLLTGKVRVNVDEVEEVTANV